MFAFQRFIDTYSACMMLPLHYAMMFSPCRRLIHACHLMPITMPLRFDSCCSPRLTIFRRHAYGTVQTVAVSGFYVTLDAARSAESCLPRVILAHMLHATRDAGLPLL